MLALFIPIDLYHLYHAALSEVLCANFVDWAKEISASLFDDHSVARSGRSSLMLDIHAA
jgi:hypothetical protein